MHFPDYDRSILSVPMSLLARYGAEARYATLPEADKALKEGRSKTFLVILDGLGSTVLRRTLPENAYLRRKTACTVTSVFPPTTTAATTTYYSGLSPAEHGWLGWHLYFKEYAADVTTFMGTNYYSGQRIPGPSPAPALLPYETVFEQIRRADPSVKLHALCAFPAYFERGADFSHRVNSFDQACAELRRIARVPGEAFAMLYWTQPDDTMHSRGTDSPEAREQYRNLNAALERLTAQLEDTLLIVVSDHGLIDAAGSVNLADHPEVMDMLVMPPSMDRRASSFFIKPHRMADFEAWFRENLSEDFIWMPREEVLRSGLLGPGKTHPKTDDFIGDGIVIATGRRVIDCNLPGLPPHSALTGYHAGLTDEEMLVDIILDSIP